MSHKLISRDEYVECYICGQAWNDSLTVAVEPQDFDCSESAAKCASSDVSDPDADHAHYWDAYRYVGAECAVCGTIIDLGGE
jgi:hypothetical protein